jgi:hypothetical protein
MVNAHARTLAPRNSFSQVSRQAARHRRRLEQISLVLPSGGRKAQSGS